MRNVDKSSGSGGRSVLAASLAAVVGATHDRTPPPPDRRRRLAACLKVGVSALLVSSLAILGASTAVSADGHMADSEISHSDSESTSAASSIQIAARRLESGNIEFGFKLDGSELWLPDSRFFLYHTANVNQWVLSSPYTMADGSEVRVWARKLKDDELEVAFHVKYAAEDDYRWLPMEFFTYRKAQVGHWLYSSEYSFGEIGAWSFDYYILDGGHSTGVHSTCLMTSIGIRCDL